jgi:hypothetical protein
MNALMKFLKFSGWSLLILLMASLVIGGLLSGLAHEGLLNHGAGHWHVVVDGETLSNHGLAELGLDGDEGFFGMLIGITVAVFCLLLVLPLVLLLGVGLPILCVLLALGGVAFALLGVAALVAAPLLVPILLLVWLLRRKSVPRAA